MDPKPRHAFVRRLLPRLLRTLEPHAIVADERGVFLDGRLVVPRRGITSAEAHDDGTAVLHVSGRRSYTIALADRGAAQQVVAVLGIGTVARHRALPPWAKHLRWLAVLLTTSPWVLINVMRLFPMWTIGLIAGLYALVALPMVLPQTVEIGEDGVLFSWLRKRRFIPYDRIQNQWTTPFGVAIELEDMRVVEIRLTQKADGETTRANDIALRIADARSEHALHARIEDQVFLARGARSLDDWLRDMRAVGTGEAGAYRTASVPRERLWKILESPSADPSAREGAAIALHASLDDEERARLAAIAAKSASPRLRLAFDAVATADDDAPLRIALEEAESIDDHAPLSTRTAVRR